MNILMVILGSFLSFLIAMMVFVKKEEKIEKNCIQHGECTKGTLRRTSLKRKSVTKDVMRISYLVTYAYKVDNQEYLVKTIFEMNMDDVISQIPETVTVAYDKKAPKAGYVIFDSNETVRQMSTSKGIYMALLVALFIGMILYHFLIYRII